MVSAVNQRRGEAKFGSGLVAGRAIIWNEKGSDRVPVRDEFTARGATLVDETVRTALPLIDGLYRAATRQALDAENAQESVSMPFRALTVPDRSTGRNCLRRRALTVLTEL